MQKSNCQEHNTSTLKYSKYTLTSFGGETYNQIDSCMWYVGAGIQVCMMFALSEDPIDIDHYLVVENLGRDCQYAEV
jgi:hypothetical protein